MIQFTRRRKLIAAINLGAALAVSGMFAGAASASGGGTAAANSTLIGSGSATTYNLMQGMDTLYNDSPGCNLIDISSVTQNLSFACPTTADTTTPPTVSATYPPYPSFALSPGYTENPANDVAFEEPPYGSGNGIKQLETQSGTSGCSSTNPTAPLSYARSSRALTPTSTGVTGDCKGLNFVAYAADGLSYFYYPEVNGHATPSAAVTNMTTTALTDAWNGTLQCWNDPFLSGGAPSPSMTYSSAGCEPIILYSAQSGSGTFSTWESFTGVNPETYLSTINGTVIPNVQNVNGSTFSETYNSNEHIILENEDRELIPNGDEANALFFFSYGKFQVTCGKGLCGKVPGATGTTTEALGQINGVTATKTSILCGAGVQTTGCTTFYPATRFIYNVYSNGSNPNIPEASPQTLNYVSEEGFICKPNTTNGKVPNASDPSITDPNTGATYRAEIGAVIQAQGFFPLPYQSSEGAVDNGAFTLLKNYHTANPTNNYDGEIASVDNLNQGATSSHGFCLVYTTDTNSTN